ncbi:MAG: DNA repair protein [Pseudomonadota bacterium]
MQSLFEIARGFAGSLRVLSALYIGLLAGFALISVALASTGQWNWLELQVPGWGLGIAPGALVQICAAGLAVALLFYLPAALKIMQLDHAHRRFQLTMEDVSKAYHISHSADRAGAFSLSSEFDAVRERMMYLRDHPDLAGLEPDVIDVAAQMSVVSRDLAETYSDERVERARAVLRQRQNEILDLQERIAQARKITDDLKRWTNQVEVERAVAEQQITQLTADLEDILPEIENAVQKRPRRKAATVTSIIKPGSASLQKAAE